jgi:hypothetical protein
MLIDVTAEDIDAGVKKHCELCAVALAIRRATGQSWRVGVDSQGRAVAQFRPADGFLQFRILPRVVTEFVLAFDAGGRRAVGPIRFEFAAAAEVPVAV